MPLASQTHKTDGRSICMQFVVSSEDSAKWLLDAELAQPNRA